MTHIHVSLNASVRCLNYPFNQICHLEWIGCASGASKWSESEGKDGAAVGASPHWCDHRKRARSHAARAGTANSFNFCLERISLYNTFTGVWSHYLKTCFQWHLTWGWCSVHTGTYREEVVANACSKSQCYKLFPCILCSSICHYVIYDMIATSEPWL